MATVFLLRHAESTPDRGVPESEWPLSTKGEQQALLLKDSLAALDIDRIFSSPYKRAVATVAPFARNHGLKITIVEDLRERKLSEGFIENWADVLRAAWQDFTFALPNCESGAACRERVKRCIEKLVVKHPGRNFLVSSHGNAIGLYLHMMDSSYGYEEWAAMRNPDLFKILYQDGVPT